MSLFQPPEFKKAKKEIISEGAPSDIQISILPSKKPKIPEKFVADLLDAVDNWLMAYKSKTNPKSVRQRKRMLKIKIYLEELEEK